MRPPKPVCVDFETLGIQGRPSYPPVPVGVAIKYPGKAPRYYGWGHPVGNNCSYSEAAQALAQAYQHKDGLLFQNGKFDVDVAEVHFGLPIPPWDKIHDTMFLLFLDDPHQTELGLKPSAARLLNLPPEEQDAVGDWLVANQPVPGVKISRSKASPHYFGRYVAYAPGELVGAYANGDVTRTEQLFNFLWAKTVKRGMLRAYDRERELMPILLEMERQGVPVDLKRLRADVQSYQGWLGKLDQWLLKQLKATPGLNLDSGEQLVEAMIKVGKIDVARLPLTPTGKYQTNKDALPQAITDQRLLATLKYRSQLKTCLGTFMEPWLATAEQSGGLIYTTWNQIKAPSGDANVGTRTGRLSSTPNFQNIPKTFTPIFYHEAPEKKLPRCPLDGLPPLPRVRSYITPFPGEVLIDRDYCFSPDTEVLTEHGFVRFDALKPGVTLAQWDHGVITYALPLEYQRTIFNGNLVHIRGARSTDLLLTPNHMCLLAKDHQLIRVRADEYPLGRYQQLHAGVSAGRYLLPDQAPRLLAAIQADATVKSSSVAWKLKKARKIGRLHGLLATLQIPYTVSTPKSAPGCRITYVKHDDLPEWVRLLGPTLKTFDRHLLNMAAPQRLEFLHELAYWDGRRQSAGDELTSWSYFTTDEHNAQLVQEMACLTSLRSVLHKQVLPSGKTFTTVSMRTNYATWTETFIKREVAYAGYVYCVTMPAGTVVVRRDGRVSVTCQSQQEPRILAHFDGGALMRKYVENPWIDFHDYAKAELEKVGKFYDRKPVKNTNLGLIYGMGVGKLALKNDMPVDEAKELKGAILMLYPGLKEMYQDMKLRARAGEPIRTWGGREYYCEAPRLVDGRVREFDYKLVNVLIQGSAADCTKQAIINFYGVKKPQWKIILNVHDQITISVPKKEVGEAMEVLRVQMERVEFDVPILSEGAVSETNWDALRDYDKKGRRV